MTRDERDAHRLTLALRNVRAMAARMSVRRDRPWTNASVKEAADHLLRFCADAGVVANVLRCESALSSSPENETSGRE